MKAPGNLEGLPWPDGDPGGLRAAGGESGAIAAELDAKRAGLVGLADPLGWQGWAESSFASSVAAHGSDLNAAARDFARAAKVLINLSRVLESAQETITRAADKLHEARVNAENAAATAASATGPGAEAARGASDRAAAELDRVRTWAQRVASAAMQDVKAADRGAAGALHDAARVAAAAGGMPVAAGGGGTPASPIAALGSYLRSVSRGASPSHGRWLGRPARALPLGRDVKPGEGGGDGSAEQWAQRGLAALAADGFREGIVNRTEGLARYAPGGRLVPPELVPSWLRGAYDSGALRWGLKYGLPTVAIGGGGILDYEQYRAEGHSVGGSARRSAVNGATTIGGTWLGRTACGAAVAATSESGGWGAAACPVVIPAGAWIGHATGEYIVNPGIDLADKLAHKVGGLVEANPDPPPILWDGPAKPTLPTPPGGGAYG